MNVKIGKRPVPIKTKCQPSGLENPPPLKVALTAIISGPNSHIPSRANRTSETRFALLPDTLRPIIKIRAVENGRPIVRIMTSNPENRYPRSQCSKTLGTQKVNPPSDKYSNALKIRFCFTKIVPQLLGRSSVPFFKPWRQRADNPDSWSYHQCCLAAKS